MSPDDAKLAGEPDAAVQEFIPPGGPLIYADSVANVIYGVATTKIVFGIEVGPNRGRSVATVVMPTEALIVAATTILKSDMRKPDVLRQMMIGLDRAKSVVLNAAVGDAIAQHEAKKSEADPGKKK